MKYFRTPSSRFVTYFLLVGIAIFACVIFFVASIAYRHDKETMESYAQTLMQCLLQDFDTQVVNVESALLTASHTPYVEMKDSTQIFDYLDHLVHDYNSLEQAGVDVFSVYGSDTTMYTFYVTEREDGSIQHTIQNSTGISYGRDEDACFQKALESGKTEWSLPYFDQKFAHDLIVTGHKRLEAHNACLYVDIKMSQLLTLLNNLTIYQGSRFYISVPETHSNYTLQNDELLCLDSISRDKEKYHEESAWYERLRFRIVDHVPMEIVANKIWDHIFQAILLSVALLSLLGLLVHRAFKRAQKRLQDSIQSQHEVEMARKKLENDIAIAAQIQLSMLNKPGIVQSFYAEDCLSVDVLAKIIPAREVGGDLYEYKRVGDFLYLCIGDVSGKGIPASMYMARCITLLQAYISQPGEKDPAEMLSALNGQLCERNDELLFATLWLGILHIPSGSLRYASAGHNPPVLIRSNHSSFIPLSQGLPLGLFEDSTYTSTELTLQNREMLLLYTDGVTEAEDPGHTLFGDERLLQSCRDHSTDTPEPLCSGILHDVQTFAQGGLQSDDITLLCIEYGIQAVELREIPHVHRIHRLTEICGDSYKASLALEEAAVNVLLHGGAHFARIERSGTSYILTSDGDEFDPTKPLPPRGEIGERGVGIELIQKLCTSLTYERTPEGLSRLTLVPEADNA